jgi:hypothetical protein
MSDDKTLEIPEHELYNVYSTLADATEAAATGDPNECAKLTSEAKEQIKTLRAKYA